MDFTLKTMDFTLKTMDFTLKMVHFLAFERGRRIVDAPVPRTVWNLWGWKLPGTWVWLAPRHCCREHKRNLFSDSELLVVMFAWLVPERLLVVSRLGRLAASSGVGIQFSLKRKNSALKMMNFALKMLGFLGVSI